MKNETKSKVIIIVIVVIILGGCVAFTYQNFTKTKPATNQEIVELVQNDNELYNNPQIKNFASKNPAILKKIQIIEVKNCESQRHDIACILVKNLTDKELYNMMVTIDLYDKDGNIITDSGDTLKKLAPNSEYTFKMPIIRENAVRWELTSVKEFGKNF